MLVAEDEEQSVLTATENGYGKRTPIVEYTRHGRGTKGMIAIQQTARNGTVVAAALVRPDDEVMLISTGGVLIRTKVKSIREMSRSTQGVTLINLGEGEKLAGLERVVETGRGRRGVTAGRDLPGRRGRDDAPCPRTTTREAELARHRAAIDALDREILERLNARAAHAQAIGALKAGGVAYRPEREAQVLARLQADNRGPLSNEAVAGVFRQVMSACLALEQTLRDRLPRAGRHVLARRGRPSTSAQFVDAVPCATIDEVFRATESGQTDYAVVPVENSTEGAIGRTLDLMCQTPLTICGEIRLRIRQNLLSTAARMRRRREGLFARAVARAVRAVARPAPARVPRASRSRATPRRRGSRRPKPGPPRSPARTPRRSTGSTSSRRTSRTSPNNTTRFWVLGRNRCRRPGSDETSLVMSAPNRPGAVLQPARAVRHARRQHDAAANRARRAPGCGSTCSSSTSTGTRRMPPVAAALAELRQKSPNAQDAWDRILQRFIRNVT